MVDSENIGDEEEDTAGVMRRSELDSERKRNPFLKEGWNKLKAGDRNVPFEIRDVIGVGGFGITYRAEDTNLRCDVAIKENFPRCFAARASNRSKQVVPNGNETGFRKALEYFKEEARKLASFRDDPTIVNVRSVIDANNTAYIVMDFVEGASFEEVIRSRHSRGDTFSEDELRTVFDPLCSALRYIHSHKPEPCFHLDIKPSNILLSPDTSRRSGTSRQNVDSLLSCSPVLIDFGSARYETVREDESAVTKSLLQSRSIGFTPFEQFQSNGKVGPWSDIYSLAATFYCAILGKPPPDCTDIESAPDTLADTVSGPYSYEFLHAIDQGLLRDRKKRPQSIAEWLDVLRTPGPLAPVPVSRLDSSITQSLTESTHTGSSKQFAPNSPGLEEETMSTRMSNGTGQGVGSADSPVRPEGGNSVSAASFAETGNPSPVSETHVTAEISHESGKRERSGLLKGVALIAAALFLLICAFTIVSGVYESHEKSPEPGPDQEIVKAPPNPSPPNRLETAFKEAGEKTGADETRPGDHAEVWGEFLMQNRHLAELSAAETGLLDKAGNSFDAELRQVFAENKAADSGAERDDHSGLKRWEAFEARFGQFATLTDQCRILLSMAEEKQEEYRNRISLNREFRSDFAELSPKPEDTGATFAKRKESWDRFEYKYRKQIDRLDPKNESTWTRITTLLEKEQSAPPEVPDLPKVQPDSITIAPPVPANPIVRYRVAYRGTDGVNIRSLPGGGKILATIYRGTFFDKLPGDPQNFGGSIWIRARISGWMPMKNLRNGDLNVTPTSGGRGYVSWYRPGDDFVSMRKETGFQLPRMAKVFYETTLNLGSTQGKSGYLWVWAEFEGWVATTLASGTVLVEPVK